MENLTNTIFDLSKLLELEKNQLHSIDGETYTEKALTRVPRLSESERPCVTTVNSLSALCALIKTEINRQVLPIFVEVQDHRTVLVYTTYRNDFTRDVLYQAVCDTPIFEWKRHLPHEQAIIAVQSQFVQNDATEYLLNLLGSITVDNSVTSNDNGVTQEVEAKRGVSLKQKVVVKPFVSVAPYRTFLEVPQPQSDMLVRVNENAEILLVEADGGMWKMAAKRHISEYLSRELLAFIEQNQAIVMC